MCDIMHLCTGDTYLYQSIYIYIYNILIYLHILQIDMSTNLVYINTYVKSSECILRIYMMIMYDVSIIYSSTQYTARGSCGTSSPKRQSGRGSKFRTHHSRVYDVLQHMQCAFTQSQIPPHRESCQLDTMYIYIHRLELNLNCNLKRKFFTQIACMQCSPCIHTSHVRIYIYIVRETTLRQ